MDFGFMGSSRKEQENIFRSLTITLGLEWCLEEIIKYVKDDRNAVLKENEMMHEMILKHQLAINKSIEENKNGN